MNIIYKEYERIYINGEEVFNFANPKLRYGFMPETKHFKTTNFLKACAFADNEEYTGVTVSTSLFGKKKKLRYRKASNFEFIYYIDEKKFHSIDKYIVCYEVDENYTIKELMNKLPADEFIQWTKDKGIENITLI